MVVHHNYVVICFKIFNHCTYNLHHYCRYMICQYQLTILCIALYSCWQLCSSNFQYNASMHEINLEPTWAPYIGNYKWHVDKTQFLFSSGWMFKVPMFCILWIIFWYHWMELDWNRLSEYWYTSWHDTSLVIRGVDWCILGQ